MERTRAQNRAASKPAKPSPANTPGYFQPGTFGDYGWANDVQEEIGHAIEAQEITLNGTDDAQLAKALQAAVYSTVGTIAAPATTLHGAGIMLAVSSSASGDRSLVAAADTCIASGDDSFVVASKYIEVANSQSAAIACNPLTATGIQVTGEGSVLMSASGVSGVTLEADNAVSMATDECQIGPNGDYGLLAASTSSRLDRPNCSILASASSKIRSANGGTAPQNVLVVASSHVDFDLGSDSGGIATSKRRFCVAGGYHATTDQAPQWRLESNGGTVRGTAAYATGGLDYAEMFPNGDGTPHAPGRILTLEGEAARIAHTAGTFILGVTSTHPTVVGGDDGLAWAGRYLRDKFGEIIWETVMVDEAVPDPEAEKVYREARKQWQAERKAAKGAYTAGLQAYFASLRTDKPLDVPVMAEAPPKPDAPVPVMVKKPVKQMKVNPTYDPKREQISRRDRTNDWTCVGLLGQLRVAVDANVKPGDWVDAGPQGVGSPSDKETRIRCMSIKYAFDKADGYAVAWCLVR